MDLLLVSNSNIELTAEQRDNYLSNAKMVRPKLEKVEGCVDNIRYRSLTREGWISSLSNRRDEKAVVRWRTHMRHHAVEKKGRSDILSDYHLDSVFDVLKTRNHRSDDGIALNDIERRDKAILILWCHMMWWLGLITIKPNALKK